jgi:two-component system CheB/CheR fusion protein
MDSPFPIVGVGASSGGVEALQTLFRVMPPAPGMAFVVLTRGAYPP